MQPVAFSYSEVVVQGWRLLRGNAKIILAYGVLYLVIQIIPGLFPKDSAGLWLVSLLAILASGVLGLAWTRAGIRVAGGERVETKELFWFEGKTFVSYWLASLALGLLVQLGLLLLIVPGIIWSVTYMFVPFLVLDKKMGIGDAFSASKKMTMGSRRRLFWLGLVYFGVALLGLLALGVGLLLAMPTVMMAQFWVYVHYRDAYFTANPMGETPVPPTTSPPMTPVMSQTPASTLITTSPKPEVQTP